MITPTMQAPVTHATPPGSSRTQVALRFPAQTYRVQVVRRAKDQPGLVRTLDVAVATGLVLSHEHHGEWLTYEQVRRLMWHAAGYAEIPTNASHTLPQRHLAFLQWLRPRLGAAAPKQRTRETKWGDQPLKGILRERHLSVQELTTRLNTARAAQAQDDEDMANPLTVASVGAAAVGTILPRVELMDGLARLFGGEPRDYFTDTVLKAIEDRETLRGLQTRIKRLRAEQKTARESAASN